MSEESNERRLVMLSSSAFSLFPQTRKERRGEEEREKGGDATRRENARGTFDKTFR